MPGPYLTDLAKWLREAGLPVEEYPDWQTRSRNKSGYAAFPPLCVMWHHTASSQSWDGAKDADYCAVGAPDAPLCNIYVDRQGVVWVLAAGATNTNGSGNAKSFSRGTVPQDSMNTRAVGMEMANGGTGEPWNETQLAAAFKASNVVNAKCGNQPTDVCTHQDYAPTRKVDPATADAVQGAWRPRSVTSSGTWSCADLRDECARRAHSQPPPDPEDDDMAYPCEGLWQLNGRTEIYAVYNVGYKTWIPNSGALGAKQALLALNGVRGDVQVTDDPNMMRAFGEILGEIPKGVDRYGIGTQ